MTAPTTTSPGDPLGATTVAAVQRRTVAVLVLTQAVGAVGITIGIATASLLARDISGSDGQAGLAQTFQVLGAALASYVLARVMAMRGRRLGLTTGYLLGAGGAVLAVVAGTIDSMVVLLLGAVLLGSTTAANNAARYAATDLAEPAQRGRALAIVVWATTIGAVAGPNLTGPAAALARWLGLPELTGPFALGSIGMLLAAALVSTLLRPDPLLLAREVAGTAGQVPSGTSWGRVSAAVRERPVLVAAVVGPRRRARRDGRGDGDDPAAHGARGRRAAHHRRRHQRPRPRHVRLRPRRGVAGRHARPPGHPRHRRRRPRRRARHRGLGPGGLLVADLRRPLPARAGVVLRHGRRLDAGRRPRAARRARRRAGLRPTW